MYIVYTSNILAVLGLRALFFLLSGMMDRFHKLDVALSLILVFVGLKMGLHHFVQIPNLVSLAVVVALLASGIVWSLIAQPGQNNHGVNRS
jgi:tellurite resistance protein TerC